MLHACYRGWNSNPKLAASEENLLGPPTEIRKELMGCWVHNMSHPTAPEGSRCYTGREELDRLSIQLLMVTNWEAWSQGRLFPIKASLWWRRPDRKWVIFLFITESDNSTFGALYALCCPADRDTDTCIYTESNPFLHTNTLFTSMRRWAAVSGTSWSLAIWGLRPHERKGFK